MRAEPSAAEVRRLIEEFLFSCAWHEKVIAMTLTEPGRFEQRISARAAAHAVELAREDDAWVFPRVALVVETESGLQRNAIYSFRVHHRNGDWVILDLPAVAY